MTDKNCSYNQDDYCLKGLAGTPCEIEGCVAHCSEHNTLAHQMTKTNDQEPTSKDLEEEIRMYINQGSEDQEHIADLNDIARHFSNWQKQKDYKLFQQQEKRIEESYRKGIEMGRNDIKQQLMKDAVEAHVLVPIYGGRRIMQTHILTKNLKLKVGSKVKLIIIKED